MDATSPPTEHTFGKFFQNRELGQATQSFNLAHKKRKGSNGGWAFFFVCAWLHSAVKRQSIRCVTPRTREMLAKNICVKSFAKLILKKTYFSACRLTLYRYSSLTDDAGVASGLGITFQGLGRRVRIASPAPSGLLPTQQYAGHLRGAFAIPVSCRESLIPLRAFVGTSSICLQLEGQFDGLGISPFILAVLFNVAKEKLVA